MQGQTQNKRIMKLYGALEGEKMETGRRELEEKGIHFSVMVGQPHSNGDV